MIDEAKVMKAIKTLEKAVEKMERPTKTEFLRAITKMKMNLEQPEEFEIPEFLRRI